MPKRNGTQILADRIATLSEGDAAVVAKWRSEVGEERFNAILKRLSGIANDGRRSELEDRWHLLMQMGAEIRRTRCGPYAAARIIQKTADKSQLAVVPTDESLVKWLARAWGHYSQEIFKSIDAARPKRSQLTASQAVFQHMEHTSRTLEIVKRAKILPSVEAMRLVGFHRFMPPEPFRGYKAMMEWSETNPVGRVLIQPCDAQGEDEGT